MMSGLQEIVAKGEFTAHDVHKQYGICLRVPAYVDKTITQPVHVIEFIVWTYLQ